MNIENLHIHFFEISKWAKKASTEGLSETERLRCEAFKTAQMRDQFAICHQLKRGVLGHYLNLPPSEIRFTVADKGKPSIDPADNRFGLEFNLSHCKHYLLLGITQETPIGVDIEEPKKLDSLGIAKRFFHTEEYQSILRARNQDQRFYEIWVQKEAVVKASGKGISDGLDQFSVLNNPCVTLISGFATENCFAAVSCADSTKLIRLYLNQMTPEGHHGE